MFGSKKEDGTEVRSFICQTINSWGYPAKDRSGCLNMGKEPHLGKLLTKIKAFSTAAELKIGGKLYYDTFSLLVKKSLFSALKSI